MVRHFRNDVGQVVVDDRLSPILITLFEGETNLNLAEWHERAHQETVLEQAAIHRQIVSIMDATRAKPPSPELRKFWAGSAERSPPAAKAATLATFVVVSNPLIRGALTAIGWLSEEVRKIETFSTLDAAIREAQQRLTRAGLVVRLPSGEYQLPKEALQARGLAS